MDGQGKCDTCPMTTNRRSALGPSTGLETYLYVGKILARWCKGRVKRTLNTRSGRGGGGFRPPLLFFANNSRRKHNISVKFRLPVQN